MKKTLQKLFAGLVLGVVATTAQAGVFFTDEALFNAALSGANVQLSLSEDFEGFVGSPSPVPTPSPMVIGGGNGWISASNGTGFVFAGGPHAEDPASTNMYGFVPGALNASALVTGVGFASLNAVAVSAEVAFFETSVIGLLMAGGAVVSSDPIPGVGAPQQTVFIGWIGAPGEVLAGVGVEAAPDFAMDNIRVYTATAVSLPATLLLLLGALPLLRRKLS